MVPSANAVENGSRRAALRQDRWHVVAWVHWTTLAAAGIFLAWSDRHQWFNADEWAFLVGRGTGLDDLLRPHNEHWSTAVVLVYRALFSLFGVRTYAPYLAVVIVAHLVLAHLLWLLLRRRGADPYLATGAVGLFAVLGIGWENLTSAFQYQFFGPLIFGIGALLLLDTTTRTRTRTIGAVGLLLLSVLFSGLGLLMVAVVAICTAIRWGLRPATIVAAPAAVGYLLWYAAEGKDAAGSGRQPLGTALQGAPRFTWRGLVDAADHALGLEVIGPVLLVLLALFLLRVTTTRSPLWPEVSVLAVAAPAFLALTAVGRSGLGAESAGAPRYSYVVVALLLPAAVFALDAGLGRGPLRVPAAVALGVVLLAVQLSTFNDAARTYASIEQEQKRRIVATAELLNDGTTLEQLPVPTFIPDLSVDDVRRLARNGDLPGNIDPSPHDLLTASVWVQLAVTDAPPDDLGTPPALVRSTEAAVVVSDPGCADVRGTGDRPEIVLAFDEPGSVAIRPARTITVDASLQRAGTRGGARELVLPGARRSWIELVTSANLRLVLPPDRALEICGLEPGAAAPKR